MTPWTSLFNAVSERAARWGVVVEQAEDEIAAINMAIGASYAGARVLTGTAGGGFCLMVEGVGLAAMSETPVVMVVSQRPGPSTGLPTRTCQGDLAFVLHAGQDDFLRAVVAPGTPPQAFAGGQGPLAGGALPDAGLHPHRPVFCRFAIYRTARDFPAWKPPLSLRPASGAVPTLCLHR